ncbi:probable protein phosphatase 2C 51 isoform X2 [Henckelia pumila]|uniref:probable protein phosphatase 2C 51 isoform X2 n=1 Tax=Henckelia pumila TaxID=405737 RepID=UPI003C6DECCF
MHKGSEFGFLFYTSTRKCVRGLTVVFGCFDFIMKAKWLAIITCLGVFLCIIPFIAHGVSVSCMMAYEEGGAPGVFNSPECPQWVLSAESSRNSTKNCQFATLQGHREYQEDRITCDLDLKFPFSGKDVVEEVTVGVAAIFDGHGGEEASELASRKILDYLFMHVVLIEYKRAPLISKNDSKLHTLDISQSTSSGSEHNSIRHEILEEALLRTIQDIDLEFNQEARERGYVSGSTAIIVLLVDGQFLIANIGDSKALLCSGQNQAHYYTGGTSLKELVVEELTRDHHPDREDEKARIIAAGGTVSWWGVPRVNGILAISRAIGDVQLKRYGVIADPDVVGWRSFKPENRYLVLASDGIFEVFTPQNVCDLLHGKTLESSSEVTSSSSLADRISRSALKAGSTDNLSVIVIGILNNTVSW